MRLFLVFLLFSRVVLASEFQLKILPINILKNNQIDNFVSEYGKPSAQYKNLFEFKAHNLNVVAYTDKSKKVYKAEFKYYKSKISYSTLKNELSNFVQVDVKGHLAGRKLTFTKGLETIQFNNNSNKNLYSYEVRWKN